MKFQVKSEKHYQEFDKRYDGFRHHPYNAEDFRNGTVEFLPTSKRAQLTNKSGIGTQLPMIDFIRWFDIVED